MRWPWVRRAMYEDAVARRDEQIAALKEERRQLFEVLATNAAPPTKSAELTESGLQEKRMAPARATIDGVEAWANGWAKKRAMERGIVSSQ